MSETPDAPPASEDCETCLPVRSIALALVFAAFAAYCAADFATGGKLTTWVAALVASARAGGSHEH